MWQRKGRLAHTQELPDTVLFGMDVAGFGQKPNKEKIALRRRMFMQLDGLVKGYGFGIRRSAPWVDTGDGALVVFPRTTAPGDLLKTMAPAILEAANCGAPESARIRFTVHRGLTFKDCRCYWGPGPSAVYDTLESPAFRHYHRWTERLGMMALSEEVHAELGSETAGLQFLPKEGLPVTPKFGETYMVQVTPVLHNI